MASVRQFQKRLIKQIRVSATRIVRNLIICCLTETKIDCARLELVPQSVLR